MTTLKMTLVPRRGYFACQQGGLAIDVQPSGLEEVLLLSVKDATGKCMYNFPGLPLLSILLLELSACQCQNGSFPMNKMLQSFSWLMDSSSGFAMNDGSGAVQDDLVIVSPLLIDEVSPLLIDAYA